MSFSRVTSSARICRSCLKLSSAAGNAIQHCRISTSSIRRKDEDELNVLKSNPYFNKYSLKIAELQKATPEELMRRVSEFRKKRSAHQQKKEALDKDSGQVTSFTKKKTLNDIVKIDLLKDRSAEEIANIWLRHHIDAKDAISIVMSAGVYEVIHRTSVEHPTFLLPLPRQHGYEYFVSQSWGHEHHFTPLINFQTFKENAPECLALTHFTELIDEKGIVLMRGEFNHDVIDTSEALCLSNQLHRYYGDVDTQRQKLLDRFTNTPDEFRHMDLIVELERMAK